MDGIIQKFKDYITGVTQGWYLLKINVLLRQLNYTLTASYDYWEVTITSVVTITGHTPKSLYANIQEWVKEFDAY